MSDKPVAIVCVGMAGSGKTTFMQRINAHLHSKSTPPYVINLDPAVRNVPFEANIDIRDSVNYKEVMKQYNLGPNGGILTSLNLFATKIDQILAILEKRTLQSSTTPSNTPPAANTKSPPSSASPTPGGASQKKIEHILIDTPGQIEVFVWSASGAILLSSLASTFPTVLAYIIDTPRTSAGTGTFMSNMLYACSILYKTKLPMILVFNKTDVKSDEEVREWMTDFEAFQAALRAEEEQGGEGGGMGESGYMSSLLNSMSLMLEEFYRHLSVVGVSSMTGAGVEEFFEAVKEKAEEFERDYRPELERRKLAQQEEKEKRREKELARLMKDVTVGGAGSSAQSNGKGRPKRREPETISDAEDDDDDIPAEMVEPDNEEIEQTNGEQDEELVKRYREALGQDEAGMEDPRYVKYLKASSIGL